MFPARSLFGFRSCISLFYASFYFWQRSIAFSNAPSALHLVHSLSSPCHHLAITLSLQRHRNIFSHSLNAHTHTHTHKNSYPNATIDLSPPRGQDLPPPASLQPAWRSVLFFHSLGFSISFTQFNCPSTTSSFYRFVGVVTRKATVLTLTSSSRCRPSTITRTKAQVLADLWSLLGSLVQTAKN